MVESITMGPIGTIGVVPAGGDRTALASTPAELAEDDAEAVGESTATKLATGAADAPDADEAPKPRACAAEGVQTASGSYPAHVPKPACLPAGDVHVDRLDPEPLPERLR